MTAVRLIDDGTDLMDRTNRFLQYLVVAIILASVTALLVVMAHSSSIRKSYHWTKPVAGAPVPPATEDHIRSLMAKVTDPELGVNIVDLGLIYGIVPEAGRGGNNNDADHSLLSL